MSIYHIFMLCLITSTIDVQDSGLLDKCSIALYYLPLTDAQAGETTLKAYAQLTHDLYFKLKVTNFKTFSLQKLLHFVFSLFQPQLSNFFVRKLRIFVVSWSVCPL